MLDKLHIKHDLICLTNALYAMRVRKNPNEKYIREPEDDLVIKGTCPVLHTNFPPLFSGTKEYVMQKIWCSQARPWKFVRPLN